MSGGIGDRLADAWGHVRAALPFVVTTHAGLWEREHAAFELGRLDRARGPGRQAVARLIDV